MLTPTLSSLASAFAIAGVISVAAWRARALTSSGALAALCVGTATVTAGLRWGAFLICWFVSAALLSRVGRATKARHVHGVLAKPGPRDARQVLANGAVFCACAIMAIVVPSSQMGIAGAAALAAAGADTWATELGTWRKVDAWSLRTGKRVTAGTSGAISTVGTLALFAGALAYALLASALGVVEGDAWMVVMIGGAVGAAVDSLIGAWWQERRWCERCNSGTEQQVHWCGNRTALAGGSSAIGNDLVNFAATIAGALLAICLSS